MLDLRRLATFREVVARRSFSAAADALDYTQSSVSQQIATLEGELGVTLIDRGSRPVRLTTAGEALLAHADELLAQAATVERELAALSRGESGTLRVGGFYTAWATFLPSAVAAFSRRYPRVQLELRQLEPQPAVRGVRTGELDLAVVYRFDDADADGLLRWTRLLDDPYAVALPADHPLAERERVALGELAAQRWVSPPSDDLYAQVLRRLCRELGDFEPDVAFETQDIAMAQPLVAAGLAVALLPALGLLPTHARVVVRPLSSTPPARSIWAVRPANRPAPAVAAMLDAVTEAAGLQEV
jgi:DNA-binding transcriptional LysR family regulator